LRLSALYRKLVSVFEADGFIAETGSMTARARDKVCSLMISE
jgi:hypothetical protein